MTIDLSRVQPATLLGRALRLPLQLIPIDWRMPVLQGPLRGARWEVGSSTHGCWLGTYERPKAERFAREVRADSIVYDLGAHAGYYTLIASRRASAGKVIAFEPFPRNIASLRAHVEMNRASNVEIYECAVGSTAARAFFRPGAATTSGQLAPDGTLEVTVEALDELVERDGLRLPTLMKIDIEGAEHDALVGATETVGRARPTIFLATHNPEVHVRCVDWLQAAGYRLEALDGKGVRTTSELLCRPTT